MRKENPDGTIEYFCDACGAKIEPKHRWVKLPVVTTWGEVVRNSSKMICPACTDRLLALVGVRADAHA